MPVLSRLPAVSRTRANCFTRRRFYARVFLPSARLESRGFFTDQRPVARCRKRCRSAVKFSWRTAIRDGALRPPPLPPFHLHHAVFAAASSMESRHNALSAGRSPPQQHMEKDIERGQVTRADDRIRVAVKAMVAKRSAHAKNAPFISYVAARMPAITV